MKILLPHHRFCIALIAMVSTLVAQDAPNTYKGQPITAENILELAPPAPDEVKRLVDDWFIRHPQETKDLSGYEVLNALEELARKPSHQNNMKFNTMNDNINARRKNMQREGVNRSNWNYVIPLSDKWMLKASGLVNRFANIVAQTGGVQGLTIENFKKFIEEKGENSGSTYQTISRLAHWLRLEEGIDKFNLSGVIGLPKMYLIHIPGRPDMVNDTNYVIVEENVKGPHLGDTKILENPEIQKLIQYVQLWDNGADNFVVRDNKIYPIDTEQSNNQMPRNFFFKDRPGAVVATHPVANVSPHVTPENNQARPFASWNTYNGKPITPETILDLAPKIPEDLQNRVNKLLPKDSALANVLSGAWYYNVLRDYRAAPFAFDLGNFDEKMRQFFKNMQQSLAAQGIKIPPLLENDNNQLLQNHVYLIGPDNKWWIKSSGYLNRRANILHEVDRNNRDNELPQALLSKFIQEKGPKTYQTISRLAYWLRAQEAKKILHLDHIALPQVYLAHIPGRPLDVDDTNYVIIEENIANGKPILETTILDDFDVLYDLIKLIGYTGLFDIKSHNFVVKDGLIYPIDTEQPNSIKPSEFFYKNKDLQRGNVGHGWAELFTHIVEPYARAHGKNVEELRQACQVLEDDIKQSWK